jgi:GTPase involved in cell partitioning and DNA repair
LESRARIIAAGIGAAHQRMCKEDRVARCRRQSVRVLCFILDASDPNYEVQFTSLKQELLTYDATLLNRSELVLFNKIDALDDEDRAEIDAAINEDMIAISALERINIDVAVARLWDKLLESKQESYVAEE